MHPDPPNVERLFDEAMELEPRARAAFLANRCANNTALMQRVKALLTAHELAGGFLPELSQDAFPTVEASALTESVGTTIGRYKLLEKLGEGGFGVVWAAEQHEPIRRRVALKIIKLGMDTRQVIARFEAERQALALMDHPNIAKVLDAGATDTGRPYFVMELTPGIPITTYCEERRLEIKDRLNLFIKICQAIQHAHQKGIIHRDIKPSNIIVVSQDGVAVPKVIDFGIAKATQAGLDNETIFTQLQQFIGTPAYMSPEQADRTGSDTDTRSDIYSLGVLLYELLTGNTPFDGKALLQSGLDEMRRIIREKEPLRPSTKLHQSRAAAVEGGSRKTQINISKSEIDKDLDWIVMKCLEKNRVRRYETANALAMDLQRHLNNETVVARPPSATYRLQKTFRRNKLMFSAATVVLAALAVGLGVSIWQARVANSARKSTQIALYAANMNLAQQAWEQNNMERLRQLLGETASYPDRNFEWYYWQRQAHLEIKTLRGHSDGVWAVAYSPDGHRVLTGSSDNTAKLWDAVTGQEIFTVGQHSDWVSAVAFSPDNLRIVTGSADHTARIWDVSTGDQLRILRGHRHWITSVAFSPDSRRIVTGSHDQSAIVWDVATGNKLFTLKGTGGGAVFSSRGIGAVAYSSDGQHIVTASHDKTARIWDAENGKELRTMAHSGSIWAVAFSPDGRRIVTGGDDGIATVWDTVNAKQLLKIVPDGVASDVYGLSSVAFSPDGRRVITGTWLQNAVVWDAQSGKKLFTLKGHSDGISALTFSPDGSRILTGSRGYTAKIWSSAGTGEFIPLMESHGAGASFVAFSPDGQQLLTGFDRTMTVWDATHGTQLLTIGGQNNKVLAGAFSHNGQRIVTGSADWTAKLWETRSGRELLVFRGHTNAITSVDYSPDDRWIVTGSNDRTAKVWNAVTGKELSTLQGHTAFINSVAFSPDSTHIATGSYDGTARVWDLATGKQLKILEGQIPAITAVHPAWEGGELTLKVPTASINCVSFSPNGQRIATGSQDGTSVIWDLATGSELLVLRGHGGAITSVAWSPDGRRIVTGSNDNTAKLWETFNGKELFTLPRHSKWITSVAFSSDGRRIATTSADGAAKIWMAARPMEVGAWQQEEKLAAARLQRVHAQEALLGKHAAELRKHDPGIVKEWLLSAPIAFDWIDGAAAMDKELIPHETNLRPRVGDRIKVGAEEQTWRAVQLEDHLSNFTQFVGKVSTSSVAYAVSYILSDIERDDVVIKAGSNSPAKIYVNGVEVHRHLNGRPYIADQDVISGVQLRAGLNVVIFKVVNESRAWQSSVRFADHADQPLKGIRITLDPL